MNVAILGASNKSDRYAFKAQKMLEEHGHVTFPVSLGGNEILGRPGFRSISEIPPNDRPIHTVTVYLRPEHLDKIGDEIPELAPSRIIFNPGTESEEWAAKFEAAGIETVEGCTLVMLSLEQF